MSERILVVNDSQEILDLFYELFTQEGYEVILSGLPIRDIREIEESHPDLIILDLLFGIEKSGYQMLQMLKMKRSTASIPVIACTAAVNFVREQEGYLLSQGVHVIYKPFDIDHLLRIVKLAMETHKNISSFIENEQKMNH